MVGGMCDTWWKRAHVSAHEWDSRRSMISNEPGMTRQQAADYYLGRAALSTILVEPLSPLSWSSRSLHYLGRAALFICYLFDQWPMGWTRNV
jgi:hypothetical protein